MRDALPLRVPFLGLQAADRPLAGDLDILFTHPEDEEAAHDLMGKLMPELLKSGLISDVLAQSDGGGAQHESGADGTWSRTCMCIVRLPEQYAPPELPRPLRHRRMDLKARHAVLLRASWPSADITHPRSTPRRSCRTRCYTSPGATTSTAPCASGPSRRAERVALLQLLRVSDSRCLCLSQLHYSLSDKGLVKCMDKKSGSRKTAVRVLCFCCQSAPHLLTPRHAAQYDTSVPARHERDIFEALQLEYVEPHRRSV